MITDKDIEQMIADCRLTTSADQEQRVREDVGQVLKERPGTQSRYRGMGLRLAVVASLAALIAMALLLGENPRTVAWADVQKKVAEQEWILIRGEANDGETFESWTSMSLKIDALKSGEYVRFVDYNNGFEEVYDPVQKTVTRARLGDQNVWKEMQSMAEMFKVIASGDESVKIKSPSPQVEIVSQISREIERDGQQWIEFELKLRGLDQEELTQMTYLIDPNTHLIRSMKLMDGERRMTARFSYPRTGPRSIRDLGVPKTVPKTEKPSDSMPSDEILAMIDNVRSSAEKFGPYIAINVLQDADAPWHVGTPSKVWADGTKVRQEYGIVDPKENVVQKPEANADQAHWWNNRWGQLWHHVDEVSDGEKRHSNVAVPENWGMTEKPHPLTWDPTNWPEPELKSSVSFGVSPTSSPLLFAYHTNINRRRIQRDAKATLDTNPDNGPEGTVLLTFTLNPGTEHEFIERFWIAPQRSHIVMQYESLSGQPPTTTSRRLIEELERSPRGIWYPTLVSDKSFIEWDGKKVIVEHITRHYLDFETKFPEGVFEPKKLPENQ